MTTQFPKRSERGAPLLVGCLTLYESERPRVQTSAAAQTLVLEGFFCTGRMRTQDFKPNVHDQTEISV
ncbi:hypothetical protein EYF80_028780 [Liparis tanakae]|uniref:Uncharacterized protein n=1 Tax=Liparis tanakae TaxID=230148 RepID=A0A4Z2H8B9_9TELE|nr:hypothetical protein EYF80_028780 [Liparis tanakae]